MATGWLTSSSGAKRYFQANGVMAKGFKKLNNVTYYFYKGSGVMATGWVNNTSKGTKYYFNKSTGAMYTGVQTVDGKKYEFSSSGI